MYEMKNRYRKESFNIVELVKKRDFNKYVDLICDELILDKEEKREFKKNYKLEYLREIEYLFFIDYIKNNKKILFKV